MIERPFQHSVVAAVDVFRPDGNPGLSGPGWATTAKDDRGQRWNNGQRQEERAEQCGADGDRHWTKHPAFQTFKKQKGPPQNLWVRAERFLTRAEVREVKK